MTDAKSFQEEFPELYELNKEGRLITGDCCLKLDDEWTDNVEKTCLSKQRKSNRPKSIFLFFILCLSSYNLPPKKQRVMY